MPIELRQLGPKAIEYLTAYLTPGPPMAKVALARIRSSEGTVFSFVPTEADDEVVHVLGSARALHPPYGNIPVDEWAVNMRDPSYTSVPSAKQPAVDLVLEVLETAAPSSFVCQNDVGFGAEHDPGEAIVVGPAHKTPDRWPTLLLQGPATRLAVVDALTRPT